MVFRQIKVDALFNNYRIQSNANNEITLCLASDALLGALKSAAASSSPGGEIEPDELVMKLAKKNDQALLSFEIVSQTKIGGRLRVAHDVRIEVMKPTDVAKLQEPLCPEPDVRFSSIAFCSIVSNQSQVHILLPPLQKVRTIVERLRPLSDILAIRANNNKRLLLAINTESVSVETEWTDCTNTNSE